MNIILLIIQFILYPVLSGSGMIMLKLSLLEKPLHFNSMFVSLFSPKFLAGFVLYVLGFISWLFILSKFKLNFAFPIAISLFFIVITIGNYFFLHESFGLYQVIGTLLCVAGIIFIVVS